MLERWGFDSCCQVNLWCWALPWAIIGMALGFIALFLLPGAPLWAFGTGLIMATIDRVMEVYSEGKLW